MPRDKNEMKRIRRGSVIRDSGDVFKAARFLGRQKAEVFLLLSLDEKLRLLGKEVIATGAFGKTVVSPEEIFQKAREASAKAIILAHNWPEVNTSPKKRDLALIQKLLRMGKREGIPLLDYLILGPRCCMGMRDNNQFYYLDWSLDTQYREMAPFPKDPNLPDMSGRFRFPRLDLSRWERGHITVTEPRAKSRGKTKRR